MTLDGPRLGDVARELETPLAPAGHDASATHARMASALTSPTRCHASGDPRPGGGGAPRRVASCKPAATYDAADRHSSGRRGEVQTRFTVSNRHPPPGRSARPGARRARGRERRRGVGERRRGRLHRAREEQAGRLRGDDVLGATVVRGRSVPDSLSTPGTPTRTAVLRARDRPRRTRRRRKPRRASARTTRDASASPGTARFLLLRVLLLLLLRLRFRFLRC